MEGLIFLLSEIQPDTLGLQNWQLGATARSNYTYIAKRTADVIHAGYDVTPATDKGDYVVKSNAYLILEACDEIVFEPGFSTEPGAQLDASIVCDPCTQRSGMAQNNTSHNQQAEQQRNKEPTNLSVASFEDKQPTESIKVYPNPTNSSFNLNSQTGTSIETLSIYSISGQLIDKISAINDVRYTYQHFLEKGTYILLIQANNNKVFHKKIVVL